MIVGEFTEHRRTPYSGVMPGEAYVQASRWDARDVINGDCSINIKGPGSFNDLPLKRGSSAERIPRDTMVVILTVHCAHKDETTG